VPHLEEGARALRQALRTGIHRIEHALAILDGLPRTPERAAHHPVELTLGSSLAPALGAVGGAEQAYDAHVG
jgi:hypothetical protein